MMPRGLRIFVALDATDMRRSVRGLSLAVKERFGEEAEETRALYVFVNKRRDRLKVLWRHDAGWSVLYQLLDGRRVVLPDGECGRVSIDASALSKLLKGVTHIRTRTRREVVSAARKTVTNQAPPW